MADSPANDKTPASGAERRKPGRPKSVKAEPSAPAVVVPFLDATQESPAPVLPPLVPAVEASQPEMAAIVDAAPEVKIPDVEIADVKAPEVASEDEVASEEITDAVVEAAPLQASVEVAETVATVSAPVEGPPSSNTTGEVSAAPETKGIFFMATIAPDVTKPATERFQALFGDVNERAKTAFEKSTKLAEELGDLTKGNVEALVASGRVAAKGAEALTQDAAEYSKKSFETATGALRSFAAAKTPVELIQLQNDFAKASFDSAIAEASKFSETWVKLAGDVFQPLSSRFAVAAEKLKAASL